MKSLILVVSLFVSAHAFGDVVSSQSPFLNPCFVKTTVMGDYTRFELCSLENRNRCTSIGKKEGYPRESLRRARTHLRNCAFGLGLGETMGGAVFGGVAGYFWPALNGSLLEAGLGAVVGGASPYAIGNIPTSFFEKVTPIKAIRLYKTLDEDVINDVDFATDIPIKAFANRLNETLRDHVK